MLATQPLIFLSSDKMLYLHFIELPLGVVLVSTKVIYLLINQKTGSTTQVMPAGFSLLRLT